MFVATDAGPPILWLSDTTETSVAFTGEYGHTYAFYVRSRDNVGQVEPLPLAPDAVIAVAEPIRVDAGPDASAREGDTVGLADVRVSYRGDPAALRVQVDWGDGRTEDGVPLAAGGLGNTHIYADDGDYAVTVRVTGANGRTVAAARRVSVANVAPALAPVADAVLPVGGRLVRAVAFSDPGADARTATADYGDGSGPHPVALGGHAVPLDHVFTVPGSYLVTLTVADDDGGTATTTFRVTVAAPPRVTGVVVNDGSAQRSMVTALTVTFDAVVTADAGAFEVRGANGRLMPVKVSLDNRSGKTVAVLVFDGPGVVGGSLADGRYTLTVRGDRVRSAATGLAVGANREATFTRLYGDADGNGRLDARDLLELVLALGSRRGDRRYRWYFDRDTDGDIDLLADVIPCSPLSPGGRSLLG